MIESHSPSPDAFRFTPIVSRPLRNFINNFSDPFRTPLPPLLPGETVECNGDGSEALVEDLGGETQVLVDEEHARLDELDGETQVMEHLDDGCGTCVVDDYEETQVMDGYEGDTQVDDVVDYQETELIIMGGETEVQDDEECVRNVCSQFMKNGLDNDFTRTEYGIPKGVYGASPISVVDKKKLGDSHSNPLERGGEDFSTTPPSTVEVEPGSFQRSFTSIRAASLRASGLAARCKALVETSNVSCHTSVEKENEISSAARASGSDHGVAEQEVNGDASMCKTVSLVPRKLFADEVHVENGNCSNDIDNEVEAKTPLLHHVAAGLSYVDSQEPGESTQADALDFIEKFVKDNATDMQLDVWSEPLRRKISKTTTGPKSFSNLSKKTTNFMPLVNQSLSFDWDDELEDEGGGDFFCRIKEKFLNVSGHKQRSLPQPQKSRRCGKVLVDKTGRKNSHGKSTAIESDSKLLFKNKKGSVLDTREVDIGRNLQMELNEKLSARCAEPTEAAACKRGIKDIFSVGPDTQLAAEAMEALFCGELVSGNGVNDNQGNLASLSTVSASKSRLTPKIPQPENFFSDGLVIRKSARISKGNRTVDKYGITGTVNVENELTATHSVENIKQANKEDCPSMIAHRATRLMFNQSNMMLNQADVAVSKDIYSGTNFLVGVGVPKGKRSRKYARDQSAFNDKSDGTHSIEEVKLRECLVTSGANSSSRTNRISRPQEYDKMKTTNDGSKALLKVTCIEESAGNKSVASSAIASKARVGNSCKRQLPINLSRSSLRKEISALLSSSPKSLSELKRKRREMNELRILFSNHLDADVVKHQKKILARLGASLAFSISDATHFVADSFVRTRNMLEAIASGKPIVTHLWLESCYQTSCLIDEKAYILRDLKKEREFGFSMPDTLVHASQQALLQNRKVIITPNSKPSKDIVATLVKAVHGRVISSHEVDKYRDNVLVLSSVEDYLFCHPFLNEGVKVYNSELLLCGIVTQRLDYERHRLFEDHVRKTVSRRSKRG